jgi:hypothetical protein
LIRYGDKSLYSVQLLFSILIVPEALHPLNKLRRREKYCGFSSSSKEGIGPNFSLDIKMKSEWLPE